MREGRLRLAFLVARDWTHPLRAGGDLYMSALARTAAAQQHEVVYVSSAHPGAPAEQILDGVKVVRLGGPPPQVGRALAYYRRQLAGRVDAVVAEVVGGMYLPYFAPLWVKEPLVCFWYQYTAPLARAQFSLPLYLAALGMEYLVLRAHEGVQKVTLAADRARELVEFGVRPAELSVIPGALSPEQLAMVPPECARSQPPTFVYIGKLRRFKCPLHLVEAVALLRSRGVIVRAVLAGYPDGRGYESELLNRITQLGLDGQIELRIDISEPDKFALLAAATAVVVPSPVEGFSFSVLEANVAGTPAIVSEGVPHDVVVERVNGMRYPFGNVEMLANCMQELAQNQRLVAEMGMEGRQKAQSYSWEANLDQLLGLVRKQLPFQRGAAG